MRGGRRRLKRGTLFDLRFKQRQSRVRGSRESSKQPSRRRRFRLQTHTSSISSSSQNRSPAHGRAFACRRARPPACSISFRLHPSLLPSIYPSSLLHPLRLLLISPSHIHQHGARSLSPATRRAPAPGRSARLHSSNDGSLWCRHLRLP